MNMSSAFARVLRYAESSTLKTQINDQLKSENLSATINRTLLTQDNTKLGDPDASENQMNTLSHHTPIDKHFAHQTSTIEDPSIIIGRFGDQDNEHGDIRQS